MNIYTHIKTALKEIREYESAFKSLEKITYKPKTMLTNRALKKEIDEQRIYIENLQWDYHLLKKDVIELKGRLSIIKQDIIELKDPQKYKVGEIIGKYTIAYYKGIYNKYGRTEKIYGAIKKGELVDVSESKLDKIQKKITEIDE